MDDFECGMGVYSTSKCDVELEKQRMQSSQIQKTMSARARTAAAAAKSLLSDLPAPACPQDRHSAAQPARQPAG